MIGKILIDFNKTDVDSREYRKQKFNILYKQKHKCVSCSRLISVVNFYSKSKNVAFATCNLCCKKKIELDLVMSVLSGINMDEL